MTPNTLSEIFSEVVASSWRASWLIVVLAGLRIIVHGRIPAQVWFIAWIIVALRLIVPFSVPVRWSPFNLTAMATAVPTIPTSAVVGPVTNPIDSLRDSVPASGVETGIANGVVVVGSAPVAPTIEDGWSSPEVLTAFWLSGLAGMLFARGLASWRFRRRLNRAGPAEDRVIAIAERESKRAGLHMCGRCVETDMVTAPALFGLMRPRLLFPPRFAVHLSDEDLRLVVRHELAHWRRGDLLAQTLLQVAVAVHWFNPLAWVAARLARSDCELACDEFVLRRESTDGVRAYGTTLLKVLGVVRARRRPGVVVAILEGRQQLANRVRMIAAYRGSTVGGMLGGAVLVAVFAAASMTRESQAQEKAAPLGTLAATASTATATEDPATWATRESTRVLTRQMEELQLTVGPQRRRVVELARRIQSYKEKHKMASLDQLSQRRDIVSGSLKASNLEVQRAAVELQMAESRLNQINEHRVRGAELTGLSFLANEPRVAELMQRVSAQEISMATLNERYRGAHPKMIAASGVAAQARRELDGAINTACNQIEAEYQAALGHHQHQKQDLERIKIEAVELDRVSVEYGNLEQEYMTQNRILQAMARRSREDTMAYLTQIQVLKATLEAPAVRLSPPAVERPGEFFVSVIGAVNAQGAVALFERDKPIVLDAIARAGGFAPNANRSAVRLIRAATDGARSTTGLTEDELMNGSGVAGEVRRGDVVVVPERIR